MAGCAGTPLPSLDASATLPQRPGVPDGWVTVSSADGTVSLVVPPDMAGTPLPGQVLVQAPMVGGATPIEIWAIGPAGAMPQPAPGESLREWLEAASWVPMRANGGITSTADESEGEVLLPGGRAYRVAITAQPGTPDASRVVAYAIGTERGFAVLRVLGHPDWVAARQDELELVPLLVEFAAP